MAGQPCPGADPGIHQYLYFKGLRQAEIFSGVSREDAALSTQLGQLATGPFRIGI